jgi:hypothetical protein
MEEVICVCMYTVIKLHWHEVMHEPDAYTAAASWSNSKRSILYNIKSFLKYGVDSIKFLHIVMYLKNINFC